MYSTTADASLVVPGPGVLSNDVDIFGGLVMTTLSVAPRAGSLDLGLDGALIYTPVVTTTEVITFIYVVSDGLLTDTATVAITVVPFRVYLPLALRDY